MAQGSADRYFQQEVQDSLKLVPEGIEGRVPYKGPAGAVLHQLVGGLRASMGYTGNGTIADMQRNCSFRRATAAGFREGMSTTCRSCEKPPTTGRRNSPMVEIATEISIRPAVAEDAGRSHEFMSKAGSLPMPTSSPRRYS